MKFAALILTMAFSLQSFAQNSTEMDEQWVSWCYKTQVIEQDERGKDIVTMDCKEESPSKTCKQKQRRTATSIIYFAVCE